MTLKLLNLLNKTLGIMIRSGENLPGHTHRKGGCPAWLQRDPECSQGCVSCPLWSRLALLKATCLLCHSLCPHFLISFRREVIFAFLWTWLPHSPSSHKPVLDTIPCEGIWLSNLDLIPTSPGAAAWERELRSRRRSHSKIKGCYEPTSKGGEGQCFR